MTYVYFDKLVDMGQAGLPTDAVQRPETRDPAFYGPLEPGTRDHAQMFGDRLQTLKRRSGLTINAIAIRGGLNTGTVSKLLSGGQQPNLVQLLSLQRAFGMASLEELLGDHPSLHYPNSPSDKRSQPTVA